jgi:phosphatidylserine/phosphatidylglycerophosphate/cardiolipin synthase-like enzyme
MMPVVEGKVADQFPSAGTTAFGWGSKDRYPRSPSLIKILDILDNHELRMSHFLSSLHSFILRCRSMLTQELGISVKIDAQHAIAHNKVMIIDGKTVITGSFNFTKAAEENNAENLLVIRDKKLADQYTKNWQEHDKHSEVYVGG